MAYSAALNTVYNHYLTAYAPHSATGRYDAHKKSELRGVYNSIVKMNKESPLFLLDTSEKSKEFAIGLKENARELRNTIASLGGLGEENLLNKKSVYSSDSSLVEATLMEDVSPDAEIPSYNIEVTDLASGQINTGRYLPSGQAAALAPETYSFDINVNDLSYEFQYNVHEGETNRDIQERLARLITNADIGLSASIIEDGNGNSALRLSSNSTGLRDGRSTLFTVSDENTSKEKGSVAYLGIDHMTSEASNARFKINGQEQTAFSNHFTIEKLYEVTLNRVSKSEEDSAEIGVKADVDSLTENINELIGGYNNFVNTATSRTDSYPRGGRLVNEMGRIAGLYKAEFEKMGVGYDAAGNLQIDKEALRQTAMADGGWEILGVIKNFANSVLQKTDQVSLNPMQYAEKTIVAYKNPAGPNYATPYITSAYSGMMFNSYC